MRTNSSEPPTAASFLASNRDHRHLAGGCAASSRCARSAANFVIEHAYMAEEFVAENTAGVRARFEHDLSGIRLAFEPHAQFKKRVPEAIGLIRTGDTI